RFGAVHSLLPLVPPGTLHFPRHAASHSRAGPGRLVGELASLAPTELLRLCRRQVAEGRQATRWKGYACHIRIGRSSKYGTTRTADSLTVAGVARHAGQYLLLPDNRGRTRVERDRRVLRVHGQTRRRLVADDKSYAADIRAVTGPGQKDRVAPANEVIPAV